MPADPREGIAQAIMKAAANAAKSFGRQWLSGAALPRRGEENAEGGYGRAGLQIDQYAVGFDGTNTQLPFTVNVSFINANGLSDDIVVG